MVRIRALTRQDTDSWLRMYVTRDGRRLGTGTALVAAATEWARQQGCTEFASDSLLENDVSLAAHRALGFVETGRVCNFRKDLT